MFLIKHHNLQMGQWKAWERANFYLHYKNKMAFIEFISLFAYWAPDGLSRFHVIENYHKNVTRRFWSVFRGNHAKKQRQWNTLCVWISHMVSRSQYLHWHLGLGLTKESLVLQNYQSGYWLQFSFCHISSVSLVAVSILKL